MGNASVTRSRRLLGRLKTAWFVLTSWVADRPTQVALSLALLVATHAALATVLLPALNPYKSIGLEPNTGTAVTLYLGLAAAAAIVAGFAGVIIVFTIGSEAGRIRQFRFAAGKALHRSWMTVVIEPFLATLLGIVAAATQVTSGKGAAPWLFELGVVLLTHGAIRLIWLLHELVEIVYADDHDADAKTREVAAETLFPRKTGS
ncbi:hypothetical protein [Actinophytocola sp.]|uniref:hypothetical protein n=1 Tax=Actinophytocola sp. TaxID=1872138 RepID=UPI003D6B63BA